MTLAPNLNSSWGCILEEGAQVYLERVVAQSKLIIRLGIILLLYIPLGCQALWGLLFITPWDWWGIKGLVLRLMDNWNGVWLSSAVHTGVEVHRMDSEISRLVKWPWLQLMCCTVCLPCSHNFRWWEEVWDGSECWLVCCHWTLEIKFNKSYLHWLSD